MIMLMHNRQSFASCNDMIDIQELHLKQIKSTNIEYFLEIKYASTAHSFDI